MVSHLFHETARVFEIGLPFARKPDDDVGGQRDVGTGVAQLVHQVPIVRARVAAVHGGQDGVGTRLDRQVERRHKRAERPELGDDLVGEVLRMAGGEAQALDARRVERVEHRSEARTAVQVASVGVHVLAKQRYLAHAGGHVPLGLGHDVLQRA